MIFLLACKTVELSGIAVSETGAGIFSNYDAALDVPAPLFELSKHFADRCNEEKEQYCLLFDVEADFSEEEPRFTVSWNWDDGKINGAPGAISEIQGDTVNWSLSNFDFTDVSPTQETACAEKHEAFCGLNMPHSAHWLPDGSALEVADTMNSRIVLSAPPDHSGTGRVIQILQQGLEGWEGFKYPNGSQVWEEDGRTLLMTTFKGSNSENQGRIVLWDITDRTAPQHLWSYPSEGYLAAVHNATMRVLPQGSFIAYAHSFGASDAEVDGLQGAIGLAQYLGPDTPPAYLADLTDDSFGFIREVDPDSDGKTLLVTDSGCENQTSDCGITPQVMTIALPELSPMGLSGAFSADHQQQNMLPAEIQKVEGKGDMRFPYEADRL